MTESNQKYKEILNNFQTDLEQTFQVPTPDKAKEMIKSAKRIFISGSGSSFAATFFICKYLNKYKKNSLLLSASSDILDSQSLDQDDLVILVSQGWGRADAYLITQYCIQKNVKLIVITGHPERLESHYFQAKIDNISIVEIKPNNEKIFCRPNSPITSLIQMCRLFDIQVEFSKVFELLQKIQASDHSDLIKKLIVHENIVLLSTSTSLAGCYNATLALREGAGKHTEVHEIESYGHGWYTIDQENRDKTLYILIRHQLHEHSQVAHGRIENLIKKTNSNYFEISTDLDEIYGNIFIMLFFANLIPRMNDINNPKGMEENRGFHKIFESN